MKILIDLQALQTESAHRGIGRYTAALTLALIDELKDHDLFVLLHNRDDTKEDSHDLTAIQSTIGEKHTIRFPLAELVSPALYLKDDEVKLSKIMRERFIEALAPDIVLVTSLFEFNALSTIPSAADRSYFCAAKFYDLIPLTDPEHYLPNTVLKEWYEDRLQQLKRADALLAISEYVRLDILKRLDLPGSIVKNISAGTNLKSSSSDDLGDIFDSTPQQVYIDTDHLNPYGNFIVAKKMATQIALRMRVITAT